MVLHEEEDVVDVLDHGGVRQAGGSHLGKALRPRGPERFLLGLPEVALVDGHGLPHRVQLVGHLELQGHHAVLESEDLAQAILGEGAHVGDAPEVALDSVGEREEARLRGDLRQGGVPDRLLASELVEVALYGGRFLAQGVLGGRAAAAHLLPEVFQVPELEEGWRPVHEDRGFFRPGLNLLPADRDARLDSVEVGIGPEAPDDLLYEPAEVLGPRGDQGRGEGRHLGKLGAEDGRRLLGRGSGFLGLRRGRGSGLLGL